LTADRAGRAVGQRAGPAVLGQFVRALVATALTWEIAVSTVPAMERNPLVPPAAAV